VGARAGAEDALETLLTKITRWRSTRASSRAPMPAELWEAAVGLCAHFTPHSVARYLGLGYDRLRRRCLEARLQARTERAGGTESPIQFVDLGRPVHPGLRLESDGAHEIEFVRPDGARMILRSRQALDLRDLACAFLEPSR
jgi:hypothetical protein